MYEVHLTGNFPRPEQLIDVSRQSDRGRADENELQETLTSSTRKVIGLQITNGLDVLVDGQLSWQDLFRPFSKLLNGIEAGTLTRWFDNNTFYRTPTVKDKVWRSEAAVAEYYRHDLMPTPERRKAIMPGPYTFAKLSENNAYASFADLVDDLAHSLASISRELIANGYGMLQFNEPSLCTATTGELEIAKRGFEVLANNSTKIMVQTYFGSVSRIVDKLLDFPVDCIGVDLYANDLSAISNYSFNHELSCGCVDGRNSLIEPAEQIVELMTKVRETVEPRKLYLGPNCDLEFLPYPVAEKKVHLLGDVRRKLNGQ